MEFHLCDVCEMSLMNELLHEAYFKPRSSTFLNAAESVTLKLLERSDAVWKILFAKKRKKDNFI